MSDLTVVSERQMWLTQRAVAIGALMATAFLRRKPAGGFDTVTGLEHMAGSHGQSPLPALLASPIQLTHMGSGRIRLQRYVRLERCVEAADAANSAHSRHWGVDGDCVFEAPTRRWLRYRDGLGAHR
jgi:hypothetical protein